MVSPSQRDQYLADLRRLGEALLLLEHGPR